MPLLRPMLAALLLLTITTAAQAGTLDDIAESGQIKLGVRQDAPPFSFLDENGKPSGYSVDLCTRVAESIARQLGKERLEIGYQLVTAEDRLQMLQNGEVDLVCGATTHSLQRQEKVSFSLMTFITGADMLMQSGKSYSSLADLTGKAIGVREGTTTERGLKAALAKQQATADLHLYDSHAEGLGALVTGEIEAYFADRVILIGLQRGSPSASGFQLSGNYFSYEPYALPLRRGDEDFKLAVDRGLATLYRSGEIARVFATWFPDDSPSDLLRALYLLQALPE